MQNPVIILNELQLPENLGLIARVMRNFGQVQLRLVSSQVAPTDQTALACAAGADDVLASCQVFPNIEAAVADITDLYGTCAQQRDQVKRYVPLKHAVPELLAKTPKRVGILFGPERTGLDNDITAQCKAIIQIPVDKAFSSMNIAMAVGVVCYELFSDNSEPQLRTGESVPAKQQEVSQLLKFLEQRLDKSNFWRHANQKPVMLRNVQNVYTRAELTEQEVRTLYGMFRLIQINKEPQ